MTRLDYSLDPSAPPANSLVPAVTVVVLDEADERVLLVHKVDNDKWALPGGRQDVGESPSQAAVRETVEETGVRIRVTGVVGVYSDPGEVSAYDDGEVRQEFSVCLRGIAVGGALRSQPEETRACRWVPIADVAQLPMAPTMRRRVDRGLAKVEAAEVS